MIKPPFHAPKYTLNDMIDSKCVYPWNETLHNFWGPFKNNVNNADESVTQIIRHHQFFVTLILARPANLALFCRILGVITVSIPIPVLNTLKV